MFQFTGACFRPQRVGRPGSWEAEPRDCYCDLPIGDEIFLDLLLPSADTCISPYPTVGNGHGVNLFSKSI